MGGLLLSCVKLIWKGLCSTFSTFHAAKDSFPGVTSDCDQNINIVAPSESREAILHPNSWSTSEDAGSVLEAIAESSSRLESLSESSILLSETAAIENEQAGVIEESSDGFSDPGDYEFHIWHKSYEVISAFTEIGRAESSIAIPNQRIYVGNKPVMPSSLANIPCVTLGLQGILDQMNTMLGTSYSLDTPSLSSLLEDCISSNYDLGTAYGRLRTVWNTDNHSTIQDELCRREENDREERRKALVGNRIVYPWLQPRFVWDLYSNRVVPRWIADSDKPPQPISHAWMDEKDRINVWTPINEREWPVPIPKDVNLNLVRIEMLNLGVEYTWLDVLCLRQEGGLKEDLRAEEWRLDVPTIGSVYESADQVVIYLSGLGKPLSLKAGDFDSDRCWFRRAWTLQEIGMWNRIIAGDTPDGPMYAEPIDEDGNYKTEILTIFHRQLEAVKSVRGLFGALENMRNRVSTNPVDKVAGLAFPLRPTTIPAYHESESLEDAWTALVNAMHPWMRVYFLFLYPDIGRGCKKWRPTWEQVMTGPLPANADWLGSVDHDDSTHVDWYEGPCIEKGLVQGLDVGSEGGDRYGELVVDGVDGMAHTFKILVTHQFPIPKDTYAMLGTHAQDYGNTIRDPQYWAIGRRLPEERFEKASVFIMNDLQEVKRLAAKDLEVVVESRNILV